MPEAGSQKVPAVKEIYQEENDCIRISNRSGKAKLRVSKVTYQKTSYRGGFFPYIEIASPSASTTLAKDLGL